MKLRKTRTRTTESGKDYHAWSVTLPAWLVSVMGWVEGMEVEAVREGDESVILRRKEA